MGGRIFWGRLRGDHFFLLGKRGARIFSLIQIGDQNFFPSLVHFPLMWTVIGAAPQPKRDTTSMEWRHSGPNCQYFDTSPPLKKW